MKQDLTNRQWEVLKAIQKSIAINKRPPSIPELMLSLKVASPNGIAKHLIVLEKKGYIKRSGGARGIQLIDGISESKDFGLPTGQKPLLSLLQDIRVANVPIVGTIAAGSPILAEQNIEDNIPTPLDLIDHNADSFYLRVKGESMILEGIFPGDLVLISKCDVVMNGELAAVMVDDEATVKRFYKRGNIITLEPANPDYSPIIVDSSKKTCQIIGKVIGLLRSYRRRL